MNQPQQQKPTFLGLPREIRDKIYESLFIQPKDIDCYRVWFTTSRRLRRQLAREGADPDCCGWRDYGCGAHYEARLRPHGTALLRTCRQVQGEGTEVMYARNVFSVALEQRCVFLRLFNLTAYTDYHGYYITRDPDDTRPRGDGHWGERPWEFFGGNPATGDDGARAAGWRAFMGGDLKTLQVAALVPNWGHHRGWPVWVNQLEHVLRVIGDAVPEDADVTVDDNRSLFLKKGRFDPDDVDGAPLDSDGEPVPEKILKRLPSHPTEALPFALFGEEDNDSRSLVILVSLPIWAPIADLHSRTNPHLSATHARPNVHQPYPQAFPNPFIEALYVFLVSGLPFVLSLYLLEDPYLFNSFVEEQYDVATNATLSGDSRTSRSNYEEVKGKIPAIGLSKYEILEADEFRLLLLKPGNGDEPLDCMIAVCSRNSGVAYEALSYAWGDPESRTDLLCNDLPLSVTENLEAALKHLPVSHRDPSPVGGCPLHRPKRYSGERAPDPIDEDNLLRGAQKAFRLINRVVRAIVNRNQWALENVTLPDSSPLFQVYQDFSPANEFARLSRLNLGSIIRLLQMPWFTRLWVFQEVAFAKEIVVLCGEQAIPWWRLAQSVMYLHHKGVLLEYRLHKAVVGVKAVVEMEKLRQNAEENDSPQDLLSILLASSAAQCTDPRDKIFAVLGLAIDDNYGLKGTFPEVQVDYDANVSQVYQSLAQNFVAAKDLRILSCVSQRRWTSLDGAMDLPSWVPDWTAIENDTPFVRFDLRAMFPKARYLSSEQSPEVTGQSILRLPCVEIDQVEWVVPVTTFTKTPVVKPWFAQGGRSLLENAEWLETCHELFDRLDNDTTTHRRSNQKGTLGDTVSSGSPLWLILVAGLTGNAVPVKGHQEPYYARYMAFLNRTRESPVEWQLFANGKKEVIAQVEASLYLWSSKRVFGITKLGRAVLLPRGTYRGDHIVLPAFSVVPLVVRSNGEQGKNFLLGEAYVCDVMNGDFVQKFNEAY
ncbi:hypothetical protein PG997_013965 [Apiospora hydei]|uniref:DUF7730 domain-containing protein n=1 Tax=Apiospora hydei TaxID=1337664 RepID=A0ABR1VBA9_9PEZI